MKRRLRLYGKPVLMLLLCAAALPLQAFDRTGKLTVLFWSLVALKHIEDILITANRVRSRRAAAAAILQQPSIGGWFHI